MSRVKGSRHLSKEARAKALVESATLTDEQICKKYRISLRTWQRILKRFREVPDPELAGIVADKHQAALAAWADKIPEALTSCLELIKTAADLAKADKAKATDPELISAVADAMTKIADVDGGYKFLESRLMDVGIPGPHESAGAKDKTLPSGSNVTPIKRAV
jgi:hypothetical protein